MLDFIQNISILPLVIIIVFSLWLIIKSADIFVEGAGSVSVKLGMSPFVVGLTIIAIGTSAPEFFINVLAAASGATGLSIGNIIGSNIAGILLGLGIASLVTPLALKGTTVWKEIPFSLMGALLILIFSADIYLNGATQNMLSRSEGMVLLFFFIIFIIYSFGINKTESAEESDAISEYGWNKSTWLILGGLAGLLGGGVLVVDSAVAVASQWGVSQNLIGLTIVAAGTSLPEIVTAIVAARKGLVDMAVGGIVGTIIFNIFFALGATAMVSNLPFTQDNIDDSIFLILVSLLFFISMFIGKRHKLEKWQGVLFILLYISYIAFTVLREIL